MFDERDYQDDQREHGRLKISYVIPCYNSSATLERVVEEIRKKMEELQTYDYEVIMVNDASADGTSKVIRRLCSRYADMKGIELARNFGQHAALMAGFRIASGDIILCMDDDGQTPADEADKLIGKIRQGYDVVYASYVNKKHSLFRNAGSRLNMKMAESLLDKPKGLYISSYFAVRRFVAEEIIKYENPYPYVVGLVLRTTNKICNVDVCHRERMEGKSGYSLKKLVSLWVNGFTSFSVKPLRVASVCGVLTAAAGLLYTAWTIWRKLTDPSVPVGWSSTIAIILMIGGMILFVLGMAGEYIGRIYICINNSPQYVVREMLTGSDDTGEAGICRINKQDMGGGGLWN